MDKKREFTTVITMKDNSTISLTGEAAQNFYHYIDKYRRGLDTIKGVWLSTTSGTGDSAVNTRTLIFFEQVIKVVRGAITSTEVETNGCVDVEICV